MSSSHHQSSLSVKFHLEWQTTLSNVTEIQERPKNERVWAVLPLIAAPLFSLPHQLNPFGWLSFCVSPASQRFHDESQTDGSIQHLLYCFVRIDFMHCNWIEKEIIPTVASAKTVIMIIRFLFRFFSFCGNFYLYSVSFTRFPVMTTRRRRHWNWGASSD